MKKVKRVKKKLWIGLGVVLVCLVIFLAGTVILIDQGVKERCETAQERYGGDCVEALMARVDSEGESFEDRNGAVWGLGQLGDERALLVLRKYYTGEDCDHEKFLCQYELKKAIKLCEGGFNMMRLF